MGLKFFMVNCHTGYYYSTTAYNWYQAVNIIKNPSNWDKWGLILVFDQCCF